MTETAGSAYLGGRLTPPMASSSLNVVRAMFHVPSTTRASPRWRFNTELPFTEIEYHTAACSGSTKMISSTVNTTSLSR